MAVSLGYGRRLRPLNAGKVDAHALARAAAGRAYAATVLTDTEATTVNVSNAIAAAARVLTAGDTFLLAFNGHGLAADTPFGFQQSWCLFDQGLLRFGDDGLDAELARFAAGVRVLVVANCCHSGLLAGRKPPTPEIRAHVVRIAACGAAELALDMPDPSRPSPFARCFIDAIGNPGDGGIFSMFDRIEKTAGARPQLEIGNPRSEAFLREGI